MGPIFAPVCGVLALSDVPSTTDYPQASGQKVSTSKVTGTLLSCGQLQLLLSLCHHWCACAISRAFYQPAIRACRTAGGVVKVAWSTYGAFECLFHGCCSLLSRQQLHVVIILQKRMSSCVLPLGNSVSSGQRDK